MRKIIALIIGIVLIISVLPVSVYASETEQLFGGLYYTVNADDTITITGADETVSGEITIPDTINNLPVKVIGNKAFSGNKEITGVIISNGVEKISEYAFYNCENLNSFSFPDSIIRVSGNSVFRGTAWEDNLPDGPVYIGKVLYAVKGQGEEILSIKEGIETISVNALSECVNIKKIILPDSLRNISNYVFDGCDNLEEITVSVNNAGLFSENGVLYNKDKTELIKVPQKKSGDYVLPDSVEYLYDHEFYNCTDLSKIILSKNLKEFENGVFHTCSGLEEIVVSRENANYYSEDGVIYSSDLSTLIYSPLSKAKLNSMPYNTSIIQGDAFSDNKVIESIAMSDNVQKIGDYAFHNAVSLKNAQLSLSLTDITYGLFQNCILLNTITIPKTVTAIKADAFDNCPQLSHIYYSGNEEEWNKISVDANGNEDLLNATIHYNSDISCYGLGHTAGIATCDKKAVCIRCNEEYGELLPHNWNNATCENPKTCADCGAKEGTALGHKYKFVTDDLIHWKECIRCGFKKNLEPHTYTNIVDTTCNGECGYIRAKYVGEVLVLVGKELRYYLDGEFTDFSGILNYDGKKYILKNGKAVLANGLYEYNGEWYHLNNGIINETETLLKHTDGKYYHIKDGVISDYTGLFKYNNIWYYIKNGVKDNSDTLVKHSDGKYYHVKDGTILKTTTLFKYNNNLHHIENGVKSNYTGLFKHNGIWYYIKNGVNDNSDTLVKHTNEKWYHVKGGKTVSDTTLVKYNNKWYHIENGIKSNYTGLFKYNNVWYYIKDGVKDNTDTLVKHTNGKWYHVKGGKTVSDTTLVKYNNKWYHIENGIKSNYTGLFKYNNVWYYIKDGAKDNTDTLVKHTNGKWYHVKGGKTVSDTTLVKYNNKWYHIENGIKSNYTGLFKYNNVWYYIKDGVKDNTDTLVKHTNGKWYHVKGGKIVYDTLIIKYGSKYYYVKDGVKTNLTGEIKVSGKTYKIKNGVVV